MKRHPDGKLTLREAWEKHYDKSELSPNSKKLFAYVFNCWERSTENPPIGEITNDTIAHFRQSCIEAKLEPTTVNSYWTAIRATLRRLAQPDTGNPRALGIIDLYPWMRKVRVTPKLPRRLSQDDLSRFYVGCRIAQFPRNTAFPPAYWWQTLVVLAYFTALRKSDLFGIKPADVDFDNGTLLVTAQKTGKQDLFPLHAVAIEHLRRIWSDDREFVFPRMNAGSANITERWREICDHAGVERFTLKHLRSTAASEAESIRPGAASLLLQHASRDVTGRHYLNLSEVLRDVVEQMPIPLAFRHGINLDLKSQAQLQHRKDRQQKKRLESRDFAVPSKPKPKEWRFAGGRNQTMFALRGKWHRATLLQFLVLKCLATSSKPVRFRQIANAMFQKDDGQLHYKSTKLQSQVFAVISGLRDKLCKCLLLPTGWNPIPCIERGNGGTYTILLPPDAGLSPYCNGAESSLIGADDITSERFLRACIASGMNQRDIAKHLGVVPETIRRWESGLLPRSRRMILKMRTFIEEQERAVTAAT